MSREGLAAEQVAERLESTRARGNKYVRFSLSEADELLTALRYQSTELTEITDEMVEKAYRTWRAHVGLKDGQYLHVKRSDTVTDVLVPYGETLIGAIREALTAALSAQEVGHEG